MTLSEKIISLRTANNMSQVDLAEKLNVSRQSVSKWETGASIPDLDKLIAISELFNLTLDELVKDDSVSSFSSASPEPQIIYVQAQNPSPKVSDTQRTIGFILLVTGLLCCILAFVTPAGIMLFFAGLYVILCSILCLTVRKHLGLVIGWTSWIMAFITLALFTSSNLFAFLFSLQTIGGIVSLVFWVCLIPLIIATIYTIKKTATQN